MTRAKVVERADGNEPNVTIVISLMRPEAQYIAGGFGADFCILAAAA